MLSQFHVVLAVAAFIFDSRNKLLIVKKSTTEKIDGGLWTVPGGKVKPNEHIIDALKREIKEEVNLEIASYYWIGEDVFYSGGKYFHGEHFLCKAKTINKLHLEKNLLQYRWITKQDIDNYEFHPNIKKEIKNIL
jgi:8-oxo-dGTP diphosphatase